MGHEQHAGARQLLAQPRVVERRHHGLARPGRRDQQVAVAPLRPSERDLLEEALLEGLGPQLDRAQHELGRAGIAPRAGKKLLGDVRNEVATVPVRLEHGAHFVDHARIARPRRPHVPFEAVDLRRMREVRRADVRSREARLAVEEPGLGMKTCARQIVRDAHLRPERPQLVERTPLGRAGVRRGQHPQGAPCRAMAPQRLQERRNPAAANECHHHIDPVGRMNLGQHLMPDPRLPRRIRQQRRVEERDEGRADGLGYAVGK